MVKEEYSKQDLWDMGLENTTVLLNELVKEIKNLKECRDSHMLDMLRFMPLNCSSPPVIGVPYDNFYYRTSGQLKDYLKDNGFLIDDVSRSNVGDSKYYHVEINLSDDEWKYEKTSDLQIRKLLKIKNIGLVDFHEQDGMIHEVILIDEKELNDKYLKCGNLIFDDCKIV